VAEPNCRPLRKKLAKLGLTEARDASPCLGEFLKGRIGVRRANYKPATVVCWEQVARDLIGFFGAGCPLDRLNADQTEKFRQCLVSRKLRDSTICRRLRYAKFFSAEAVQRGYLGRNPFEHVKHREGFAMERRAYVSIADTLRVMEEAPNVWRRLMIALSRFAGLRCPNETFSLRWQDVNWEKGILLATSPKTDHLPGRGRGLCRCFWPFAPTRRKLGKRAPRGPFTSCPKSFAIGPRGRMGGETPT